jgi:hypothetical protein
MVYINIPAIIASAEAATVCQGFGLAYGGSGSGWNPNCATPSVPVQQVANVPNCVQSLANVFGLDYSQLLYNNGTQSTQGHIIQRHMNGTTSGTSQYYASYFWQVELINIDTFLFGTQQYNPSNNTIVFTFTYPSATFGGAQVSPSIGTDPSGAKTATNRLVVKTDCKTVITSYPVP